MERDLTIALIVARPGPLRDSLQTLLASMPQIQVVAESKDMSALLGPGAQLVPDLVLLDASFLGTETCAVVQMINAQWPQTRTVILVENASQQQQAQAGGADAVLYQGYPAGHLVALVEDLLGPGPGSTGRVHVKS